MYMLKKSFSNNLIEFNLSNNISHDALLVLTYLSLKVFYATSGLFISNNLLNMDSQHDTVME